jgi:hypothetical protein
VLLRFDSGAGIQPLLESAMAAKTSEPFVGQHVIANGYPGTITRVCEWSDSMVEVRLASGTVCVDYNGIDCKAA